MYYQDEHYCFSTYEWALLYIFFRWKERNWHPTCTYVLNMQFIHSLMSTTNNRALTYVNCSNGTEAGLRLYLCHSFCSQIEWATEFYMPSLCVCGERENVVATCYFLFPNSMSLSLYSFPLPNKFAFGMEGIWIIWETIYPSNANYGVG